MWFRKNNPDLQSNMTVDGMPGASLRVWRDYYKHAQIHEADIDKDILFQENRITTFYVDQLNTPSIETMWKEIGIQNFDIIIEDVNTLELNNIMKKLNKFNPELIVL
jgi:hypothetical protein